MAQLLPFKSINVPFWSVNLIDKLLMIFVKVLTLKLFILACETIEYGDTLIGILAMMLKLFSDDLLILLV